MALSASNALLRRSAEEAGELKFLARVRGDDDRVSVIFAEQHADADHVSPELGERALQIALR